MAKRKAQKHKAPKPPFSLRRNLLAPLLGIIVMLAVYILIDTLQRN